MSKIVALGRRHKAAVETEMRLEVRPGRRGYKAYKQAQDKTQRIERELRAITKAILSRRVRDWSDVIMLAQLAVAWEANPEDWSLPLPEQAHPVMHALLFAILQMG